MSKEKQKAQCFSYAIFGRITYHVYKETKSHLDDKIEKYVH